MGKRPNGTPGKKPPAPSVGTHLARAATLGEMRSLGLHSLDIICTACGHHTTFKVDEWPDELPMRAFGPHIECKKCGHRGASVRPDWTQLRAVPGGRLR
jgi:ribosomal protein L37E